MTLGTVLFDSGFVCVQEVAELKEEDLSSSPTPDGNW